MVRLNIVFVSDAWAIIPAVKQLLLLNYSKVPEARFLSGNSILNKSCSRLIKLIMDKLKPSVNVVGTSSKKSTVVIQSTGNEYMSDGGS